jgi:hypothetical protein
VRCDAAVAEKPAGEEETAGEKFEYQAEVGYRIREFGTFGEIWDWDT